TADALKLACGGWLLNKARGGRAWRPSLEARHDLFAEKLQGPHHMRMRDQAAGVELRQDAVETELLAHFLQPVDHPLGRADDHAFAQHLLVVDRQVLL